MYLEKDSLYKPRSHVKQTKAGLPLYYQYRQGIAPESQQYRDLHMYLLSSWRLLIYVCSVIHGYTWEYVVRNKKPPVPKKYTRLEKYCPWPNLWFSQDQTIILWEKPVVSNHLHINTPLECKQSRGSLHHIFINVLEVNIESPIWKTFFHNDYAYIGDLVTIIYEDVPYIFSPTNTKTLKYISKGNHNLIHIFVANLQYQIHNNNPVGSDWTQVTNDSFNAFCMANYYTFRSLRKAGLINTMKTSTTSFLKQYSSVERFKRNIKCEPTLFLLFKYQAL